MQEQPVRETGAQEREARGQEADGKDAEGKENGRPGAIKDGERQKTEDP
jgi:hypothetical protein